jgi:hypothetical protein
MNKKIKKMREEKMKERKKKIRKEKTKKCSSVLFSFI